jgi:voltage-gated potassium channel
MPYRPAVFRSSRKRSSTFDGEEISRASTGLLKRPAFRICGAVNLRTYLLTAWSPTYALADKQKRDLGRLDRARLIKQRNCTYLIIGITLAGATFVLTWRGTGYPDWGTWWPILGPLTWYLLSRCNEVFIAFYLDAFDKLRINRRPSSALAWPTRVRLALNSYAELILNFSVLYALLPADMWQCGAQRPVSFTDLMTYSALTITTSGGGGFVAKHWVPQLLTVYEVMCGLILLVVSFTIYTGRGLSKRPAGSFGPKS